MDKKLVGLMFIFFLSFGVFASLLVFKNPIARLTRASEEFAPSSENSLIIGCPLPIKADSVSACKLFVFVTSKKGTPVANKTVSVATTLGNFKVASQTSDNNGKAVFELTSATPGEAKVSATVDNTIPVTKTVIIQFN